MIVTRKYADKLPEGSNRYDITTYPKDKYKYSIVDTNTINDEVVGEEIRLADSANLDFLPDYPNMKGREGADGVRLTMLMIGPSGAGKTFLMCKMMTRFQQKYPRNNIYLLTAKPDSKKFKQIKNLEIFNITVDGIIAALTTSEEGFTFDPVEVDMFGLPVTGARRSLKNNLICIDDCDCLSKNDRLLMDEFTKKILFLQRHSNTSCIWCRHELTGYNQMLQKSLNEIQYIVLFRDETYKTLRKFVEKYLGLDKSYVTMVTARGSRYTMFCMKVPKHIIQERRVLITT